MDYEKLPIESKERQLVNKIFDAADEERGLIKQINAITCGADISDVESLTLPEDTSVIPESLQRELEEKRAEIAGYIKEAVKLGLGELGMIKANYEKYVGKPMPKEL